MRYNMSGRHGMMSNTPFHIESIYHQKGDEDFIPEDKFDGNNCISKKANYCYFCGSFNYKKRCYPFKCKVTNKNIRNKNATNDCPYRQNKYCYRGNIKNLINFKNCSKICDYYVPMQIKKSAVSKKEQLKLLRRKIFLEYKLSETIKEYEILFKELKQAKDQCQSLINKLVFSPKNRDILSMAKEKYYKIKRKKETCQNEVRTLKLEINEITNLINVNNL